MPKEKDTERKDPLTMEVTDEMLVEVINLARLNPLEAGMFRQKQHLRDILAHFQVLSGIELEGIDPTIQINPNVLPLRDDEVISGFSRDDALHNARLRTSEFFRGPGILGGEEQ